MEVEVSLGSGWRGRHVCVPSQVTAGQPPCPHLSVCPSHWSVRVGLPLAQGVVTGEQSRRAMLGGHASSLSGPGCCRSGCPPLPSGVCGCDAGLSRHPEAWASPPGASRRPGPRPPRSRAVLWRHLVYEMCSEGPEDTGRPTPLKVLCPNNEPGNTPRRKPGQEVA